MTDVAVVGGGIIGLATARALALRGARVTVLERGMVAAGTSSRGEGNMLVSDKEISAEAALALRSLALWEAFAGTAAEPFEYEQKGGIITAASERQLSLLGEQADRQREMGIRSTVLDAAALRACEPNLSPSFVGGLHYPQDAQVMPIHAVRALARAAIDLGVTVRTRVDVVGLVVRSEGLRLSTTAGAVDADVVVNATGPWAGEVAAVLGGAAAVHPRRGVLLVTEPLPQGTVRHKVYDGRYVEAVASDEADAQVAPVIESTASGTILIGSTREAVGWDTSISWDLVGRLAAMAVEMFPAMATASVIRTYQGFRPATPDHLPLIGPDAVVPGLFHHSGHEGAGIGLALGSAELLADAVLDSRVDPAFDPRRLATVPAEGAFSAEVYRELGAELVRSDTPAAGVLRPEGGPSLAMSNLSTGRQSWRRTRFGDAPRGLFCGIGHCHDCVVTDLDGRTVRACLVPASRVRP